MLSADSSNSWLWGGHHPFLIKETRQSVISALATMFSQVSQTRTVTFGRINRRADRQTALGANPFSDDLKTLADSRMTRAVVKVRGGEDREWIAADLSVDPYGGYLTGVLGYTVIDPRRVFDQDSWSWVKGEVTPSAGASPSTMVPFAVNLEAGGRWVAFATSRRIQYRVFQDGFSAVLNHAVRELNLWPTDWEFDLVTSRKTVQDWIQTNPKVVKLVRKLQFSNPGLDLDSAREHMRALNATAMREEFQAGRNGVLSTDTADFASKLEGVETGDASIELEARPADGGPIVRFRSSTTSDTVLIDEFGSDLHRGMELVQRALFDYVSGKNAGSLP